MFWGSSTAEVRLWEFVKLNEPNHSLKRIYNLWKLIVTIRNFALWASLISACLTPDPYPAIITELCINQPFILSADLGSSFFHGFRPTLISFLSSSSLTHHLLSCFHFSMNTMFYPMFFNLKFNGTQLWLYIRFKYLSMPGP